MLIVLQISDSQFLLHIRISWWLGSDFWYPITTSASPTILSCFGEVLGITLKTTGPNLWITYFFYIINNILITLWFSENDQKQIALQSAL